MPSFSCKPAYGGYIAHVEQPQDPYGPYVAPKEVVCSSKQDAKAAFAAWLEENDPQEEA